MITSERLARMLDQVRVIACVVACVVVALVGARVAAAEGGVDAVAGAPAPSPGAAVPAAPASADSAAPASESAPDTAAGPGLFESAGGDAAKEGAAAAPAGADLFKLSGYGRGDVFAGKAPGTSRGTMKASYGELSLALHTTKTSHGDGFAEARFRYGLQGDEQRTFVDLREAYVNAYLGPIDLRLGQQIIVWGRADALNPTSNLTPVDFRIRSPLEDDIRVGNVGARMFLRQGPLRLETVWMPVYLPTVLPPVVLPQYVNYGAPTYPSPDLANGLEAGRLHLELASFEMSVSYLYGYAPLPGLTMTGLTLTGTQDPPPSVVVSRTAYRHQVVGADFSTALGDAITLRGEAAYRRPFDYKGHTNVPNPDLQYVLGADHTFGSLSVIAQYMGRYVFNWQKQDGPMMPLDPTVLPTLSMTDAAFVTDIVNSQLAKTNQILFSQTARLQHIATLRLEWMGAHDTLSISALCMVNVTTHEMLFTPRIGYRLTDALTAYVGAQIFRGPDDTLFGLIDDELSAGYAELRVAF